MKKSQNKAPITRSTNFLDQKIIDNKIQNFQPKHRFGFSALGGSQTQTKNGSKSKSLLKYSSSGFCETRSEISMWRAVITQAIIDAVSSSKRGDKVKAKNSALAWFDIKNENFLCVCKFAEMSPQDVLSKSLKAIDSCHLWKRDIKSMISSSQADTKKNYYKTSYQRQQEDFSRYESAWS